MYKTTSGNAQSRREKLTLADLAHVADEEQTAEEQRRNMVRRVKQLEEEILSAASKEERRRLGLIKFELCQKISALRHKSKSDRSVEGLFIEVAREMLSTHLYKTIMDKASDRWRAKKAADEADSVLHQD